MKHVAVLILLQISAAVVRGEDLTVDYLRDVKPVLRERCYACHGALKTEAGLRLDTAEQAHLGGESGPVIVSGDADNSLIVERIAATDDAVRMPPEGKPLTSEQISVISRWIESGAKMPDDEQPEQDPRQHWAFKKPLRIAVPQQPDSPAHPIDAFIRAKRSAVGISAMPATNSSTLLRRVYLDLIGLPPSADDIEAFVQSESTTAYDDVVNRLLESPQHGERWGRHWMDVWRYSDWYGRRSVPDVMNSYPMIWRWRDWIVQSINDDKPYDQMVTEMIAADELLPADDENIVATGYLVRSWFKWNYETWKKDLVEHTGKAFLGLTMNCCQCHDHKYDPITQEEYFRFRAFFEPLELRHDRIAGEPDPGPFQKYDYAKSYGPISSGMVRVFDEYLDAKTYMFSKGDARLRIEGKPEMTPAVPAFLGGDKLQISTVKLPLTSAYPGMKESFKAEERSKRQAALAAAKAALDEARNSMSDEPSELRDELARAEEALRIARKNAELLLAAGSNQNAYALEGTQSLVLDAKVGRRALSHALPGLDALAENATVAYQVKIIKDGHTNFQFALDIAQGLTGGFVAFENGNVKTYSPGGFNEFVAGTYDLSKGQNHFSVKMQLDLPQNQFLLTVTSLMDNALIVDATPAALNGWKPQVNGKRGAFLDCRPGTEAIYDAFAFAQPDGAKLESFDFESPSYGDGQDVVDAFATTATAPASVTARWMATGFCQAPATSKVLSAVSTDPAVLAAVTHVAAARQALRIPILKIAAAEATLAAAELELKALELRIEADTTRYSTGILAEDRKAEPVVERLIHAACQCERDSAVAAANANLVSADLAIASAEEQVADAAKLMDQASIDAGKKELQTAKNSRSTATNEFNVASGNLSKVLGEYSALSPKYPQVTTGRRSVLAKWIANRDNPLTARVAVNHIWLRHFGQPLVETTHDFGRNGSKPTHPELLDWLACELMDSGWSMKHIHRLIVTSQTYQQASMLPQSESQSAAGVGDTENHAKDPDNRTYWRFPASRMHAEVVRDSLLEVAGELDTTMGGHEIDHHEGLTSHRRSIYFAHHGEEKMEFLELFDAANPFDCYKRSSSVQPQQALALTNSELTKKLSRQLQKRLWTRVTASSGDFDRGFVRLAFLQILNREPRETEMDASLTFLQQQASRLRPSEGTVPAFDPVERSRENLIHALMNHNDFVTIR